jgi:hypothetical protein
MPAQTGTAGTEWEELSACTSEALIAPVVRAQTHISVAKLRCIRREAFEFRRPAVELTAQVYGLHGSQSVRPILDLVSSAVYFDVGHDPTRSRHDAARARQFSPRRCEKLRSNTASAMRFLRISIEPPAIIQPRQRRRQYSTSSSCE